MYSKKYTAYQVAGVTTPKTFEQCVVVRVGYMRRGSLTMENELTFVAPEGVYSFAEGNKPIPINYNVLAQIFPTHPTTITVRFPAPKKPVTPGLGQLLGSGNDFWKEKGLTLVLRGRWTVVSTFAPWE
ncbi:hypothetical protein EDB89DRAFT_1921476 [Lactarius sanguifluus]|nr:hypothetical protein EDB89DRAFT_1921476 [Lactarius sanguifluus]